MIAELGERAGEVRGGGLARMEEMLVAQAHSLDAIFNRLAAHASSFIGERPDLLEAYLKLALRAQSQCKASIEALGALKNPPMVFAKQANIAHGHQQVNNGVGQGVPESRTQESRIPQTELLEASHGEWMDARAPGKTVGADQAVEAVGKIDRAQERGGEGAG